MRGPERGTLRAVAQLPVSPVPGRPYGGLCEACVHRREVPNTRGSRFLLCQRSRWDPAYPRYPRLPVERCNGFARSAAEAG